MNEKLWNTFYHNSCETCGKTFKTHQKRTMCCSKKCLDAHYRKTHYKKCYESRRKWRRANPEKMKQYNKTYFEKHPEMRRKHIREHNRKWREDPVKNVIQTLRKHNAQRCNDLQANKLFKHSELLGCDGVKFKKYIESKFYEGMTWKNYGVNGWHIDHIKRLADFDLTNPKEQKIAFHYTNLQPMWKEDHLKKTSMENKEWRWNK